MERERSGSKGTDHRLEDGALSKAQEKNEQDNMVDWLGRPAEDRRLGGWNCSVFILGVVTCGYFAFGGIFFNLVLYLIRVRQEGTTGAADDLTNLVGTMYVTTLIGAFFGDSYLGRLRTVVVFLIVFMVGSTLAAVAVTLEERSVMGNPPDGIKAFLFISLYITAFGSGGYQPVIASFGGDQFDTPQDKARFFSWVYVSSNVGVLLSLTILTYIENSGKWGIGFWISSAAVMISFPIFLMGASKCRQVRPGGNPLLRIVQVFVCVARKFRVKVSPEAKGLYETEGEQSAIPGCRKIGHSKNLRWLDKAATVTDHDFSNGGSLVSNPWRLCTVTQVQEVKCLIRVIPVVITVSICSSINAQLMTLFIAQGATMDTSLGRHFQIPPGSMRVFANAAGIIFPPVYDYLLVPRLRARTGHPKGLTTLQRIGWGLVVATGAMVVAALVEMRRLHTAQVHGLVTNNLWSNQEPHVPLSILWLIPQFAILGIANVWIFVGTMDFFYTEISDSMRSIGSSLQLVCIGLGNYGSTVLVSVVTSITTRGGKVGWIARKNLNLGHLDYFYWLLCMLLVVNLILFVMYAYFYTYLELQLRDGCKPPAHEEPSPPLPLDENGKLPLQNSKVEVSPAP